jgi:hypothetical protein
MDYAHIKNGRVVNIVVWDGKSELTYASELVPLLENVEIGWEYVDEEFVDNRPKTEGIK